MTVLKDKVVLLTGASGDIGREITRGLATAGARLALHYHADRRAAETLVREIRRRGGAAAAFRADLRNPSAARSLVAATARWGHGLDVLIHAAGAIPGARRATGAYPREWEEVFALRARAGYLLACAARPLLREKSGRIVFVGSISAKYGGTPATIHYAAANAALEAVARGLSRFWGPEGIRVNVVRPGAIVSTLHRRIGRTPRDLARRARMVLLRRLGTPAEVARAVIFLAGEGSDYATGVVLDVSGGD